MNKSTIIQTIAIYLSRLYQLHPRPPYGQVYILHRKLHLLFVSSRLSLALHCNDLPAEKKKKLRRFIGILIIIDIGIVSTSIQRL